MDVKNLEIRRANIVLVFDHLNEAEISRDSLRSIVPDLKPEYVEVPGVIWIRYPQRSAAINILFTEPPRLEALADLPDEEAWKFIPLLAWKSWDVLERTKLRAYGFNFFAALKFADSPSAREFLLKQFSTPLKALGKQVEGEIASLAFRLTYLKDKITHQLSISPETESEMTINLNIHYDSSKLPNLQSLTGRYLAAQDDFVQTVSRLFEVR